MDRRSPRPYAQVAATNKTKRDLASPGKGGETMRARPETEKELHRWQQAKASSSRKKEPSPGLRPGGVHKPAVRKPTGKPDSAKQTRDPRGPESRSTRTPPTPREGKKKARNATSSISSSTKVEQTDRKAYYTTTVPAKKAAKPAPAQRSHAQRPAASSHTSRRKEPERPRKHTTKISESGQSVHHTTKTSQSGRSANRAPQPGPKLTKTTTWSSAWSHKVTKTISQTSNWSFKEGSLYKFAAASANKVAVTTGVAVKRIVGKLKTMSQGANSSSQPQRHKPSLGPQRNTRAQQSQSEESPESSPSLESFHRPTKPKPAAESLPKKENVSAGAREGKAEASPAVSPRLSRPWNPDHPPVPEAEMSSRLSGPWNPDHPAQPEPRRPSPNVHGPPSAKAEKPLPKPFPEVGLTEAKIERIVMWIINQPDHYESRARPSTTSMVAQPVIMAQSRMQGPPSEEPAIGEFYAYEASSMYSQ